LKAAPDHTDTLKTYDSPLLIKQKIIGKKDSIEADTDYKQKRAKDYLIQQHRNSTPQ
jgi:hypothetical protein